MWTEAETGEAQLRDECGRPRWKWKRLGGLPPVSQDHSHRDTVIRTAGFRTREGMHV